MKDIHGVCPVVPTLFDDSDRVDLESLPLLIDSLIQYGVDGLTMFGVGSEFYKLSDDERSAVLDLFVSAVGGRASTIVSVTAHSTLLACRQAEAASRAGADALMILPPFFASPDMRSVLKHIDDIARTVDIPVILQYAPEETKMSIPLEVFLEIAEKRQGELYVKVESKPSGSLTTQLVQAGIRVLTGKGGMALFEALERGASGVMPGCSIADRFVRVCGSFTAGDRGDAFAEHNHHLPYLLFVDQSAEFFLAAEKHVLKRRGLIPNDRRRRPYYDLEDKHREILDRYCESLGF